MFTHCWVVNWASRNLPPVEARVSVVPKEATVEGINNLARALGELTASIFHFGDSTIAQAKAHMAGHGIAVRP